MTTRYLWRNRVADKTPCDPSVPWNVGEQELLDEALTAGKAARKSLPKRSYVRGDEQRMNAYEAGYISGYLDRARQT
jgi:hypothetical protein